MGIYSKPLEIWYPPVILTVFYGTHDLFSSIIYPLNMVISSEVLIFISLLKWGAKELARAFFFPVLSHSLGDRGRGRERGIYIYTYRYRYR